jgi:hypothetical protein
VSAASSYAAKVLKSAKRLSIFECIADECMLSIFEVHDPEPARRPGGRP